MNDTGNIANQKSFLLIMVSGTIMLDITRKVVCYIMKDQDIDSFKQAMSNYPTGVTVMSTMDKDGNPVGLTVNSFASVSIDPLLVLWSINKGVSTYPPFSEAEKFAVNMLAHDQTDIAQLFSSKEEDRFAHCEWEMSAGGLPIIKGTAATMECTVHHKIEVGTHITFFGEVFHMTANDQAPLLYHRRKIDAFPMDFHKK